MDGEITVSDINVDNINSTVLQLIDDNVVSPWEYCDPTEESDHIRLVTLGYIRGALDLADELKKFLKLNV